HRLAESTESEFPTASACHPIPFQRRCQLCTTGEYLLYPEAMLKAPIYCLLAVVIFVAVGWILWKRARLRAFIIGGQMDQGALQCSLCVTAAQSISWMDLQPWR